MNTKYVNIFLNVLIAVAVIWTGYLTWKYVNSFRVPSYEVVEGTDISWTYQFTTEDGQIIESTYFPAWHDGRPVAYDPVYKKSSDIAPEYVNEIREKMPPSQYGFFARWAGWLAFLAAVLVGIGVWLLGIVIKEFLLAVYASITGNFLDVAYFFKEDRWAGNSIAHKAFKNTVDKYVSQKRADIERRYQSQNARMLTRMLDYTRHMGSPRIPYLLTMTNKTMSQPTYLGQLIAYWEQQIGKDPTAEENITYLRALRTEYYADYTIFTKDKDVDFFVSSQLNKVFEHLMGEPVFSFEAYSKHYMPELKVDLELTNSLSTFTISSEGNKRFPGINIIVNISRKGNVIWRQVLNPKCNYTVGEGSFVASDMYDNMIKQTIMTLSDKVK